MSIITFDIPEEHTGQVAWLEDHLLGVELPELVMELEAIHQPQTHKTLLEIMENRLPDVLQTGLDAVSPVTLKLLLTNPRSLFELQEAVLTSGSQHWTSQSASSGVFDAIAEGSWQAIQRSIAVPTMPTPGSTQAFATDAWFRRPLLVSVATAAVVLAAVFLPKQFFPPAAGPVAATGWGWDRAGALDVRLPADQYMTRLADAADEWFRKRPDSARSLAVRIAEFRQGCSTLILAAHQPLAEQDRQWLVDKCRAWATKLDSHLAAVERGESLQSIRDATDETISKLRDALRARSAEISARSV